MSVRDSFFDQRGDGLRITCMVSKYDYSPLRAAIESLPAATVQYVKPSKEVMAAALAECMGWRMEERLHVQFWMSFVQGMEVL